METEILLENALQSVEDVEDDFHLESGQELDFN